MWKEATPVPDVRSPTIRRRELGALLRARRQELGLTVEQVADRLLCSPSKVSRMETGQRGTTLRDVRDLCQIYGLTEQAQIDDLMNLAREGKQQAWWQSYDLTFSKYVGLEAEAVSIKYYQSTVIPGLLQTADYARAMHEVVVQPKLSPERIDELVAVRLTRQELLRRDPPVPISVVIDEAALHRVVGGVATMRGQLTRLIEVATLPNVTIRIIPYAAGAHAAMDSTFRILEFGGPASTVVYVEGLVGFMYMERPSDVAKYEEVFERLSDISLTPQESIEHITRIGVLYENASV
jgi:transcriptional regulator with XRE-family HTH domain